MPIENERKYVLNPSVEDEFPGISIFHKVEQGYIQNSAKGLQIRFRKVKFYKDGEKTHTGRVFTLKSKNSDFTSTEIEQEISKDDFNAIWPKVTHQLTKTRYKVPVGDLWWEIDVFHGKDGNYFWMAEIELPGTQEWPESVPDYIEKHLLYKVPLTDGRFSSRKLYDEDYANILFGMLKEKEESNERI